MRNFDALEAGNVSQSHNDAVRCNFLLMCDYARRLDNGSPLLSGIFRQFSPPTFPGKLDPFFVVCEVEVDPPEAGRSYFLDLTFADEDGKVLFTKDLEVMFERHPQGNPSFAYIDQWVHVTAPIEQPGLYRFDLTKDDDVLGQVRLEVVERL